ncbi:MAG: type II toxin-antitoxin system VapC family toxin [Acidobacteria bacterium]|nr:type II toxin-antitoxin system VapC family toxin [Acidobacteriota bacterium]MSO61958.1 type II toxin-antitoxin system VapC family toxin [Acidobacteriota bacterium]
MIVLLDTHVWIWWLTPNSPLSRRERDALDALATRGGVSIAAISLWEAQMLHRKGRLEVPLSFADWIEQAADPRAVRVLPLDTAVVLALDALPKSFHGDPADRLIVATAKAHSLPIATRDTAIGRARIVPVWKP